MRPRDVQHGVRIRALVGAAAGAAFAASVVAAAAVPALRGASRPEPGPALALGEQLMVVASGYVLKPAYMLLCAVLIAILRRRGQAPDLGRLSLALEAFLAGEAACAANYLAFAGQSVPLELLHGLGMAVMCMLLPMATFELLDSRVVQYTDRSRVCSFQRLCSVCTKRDNVPCGLHKLFLFAAGSLPVLALMPLSVPLVPAHRVVWVFGTAVRFDLSMPVLIAELRAYPLIAVVALLTAAVRAWPGHHAAAAARWPFFLGFGLLSYALFRFVLVAAYRDQPHWANFWEEATELLVILAVAVCLWTFGRQLGLRRARVTTGELDAH
ncbi:MAG: hypothetical protein HYV63_24430 [Candidatus Schekmanbacteria bacterium]|nr:hypothetical protein [Candidatus Schekmanbacteria bacterium]